MHIWDPAYPQRQHLQCPYKHYNMKKDEEAFNKAMSKARVSVEWVFGEIASYFAFVNFKKNQKKLCQKFEQCIQSVPYLEMQELAYMAHLQVRLLS